MAKGQQLWASTRKLVEALHDVLESDHPHTARECFYRMVAAGVLRNEQPQYSAMCHLLTQARERGDIEWEWIEDHTREQHSWSSDFGHDSAEEAIALEMATLRARRSVHLCHWKHQPNAIIVMVEKDAALNTLKAICESYPVLLYVLRGFPSASYSHLIAQHLDFVRERCQQRIHVLYFGDHDPSGRAIEETTQETLRRYAEPGLEFASWRRLGVLKEDGRKLKLIPNPEKQRDGRTPAFLAEYGQGCYELEAVPSDELRRRLREAIEGLIDHEAWRKIDVRQKRAQKVMDKFQEQLNAWLKDFRVK